MKTESNRPEGYMESPYIGKDGKEYHSVEALKCANDEWLRRMYPKNNSRILRDYTPNTI